MVNEYHKGAVTQISTVLGHVYHVRCRRVVLNGTFQTFIWPRFPSPQFRKYKIYEGHLFFSKYLKFIVDFKNLAKNLGKLFCFWDNCISIDIVKLSLLRTGFFLSAANVLRSSPKIWHVNNRDFLQVNWLGTDQWIW